MSGPDDQRARTFVDTLQANVDNDKLDDEAFRKFVRNSLTQFDDQPNKQQGGDYVGPYGIGVSQNDR